MNVWLQLLPAISGLVGALIGSGSALFGQHLQRRNEFAHKRQSIGFALAAEIEAYLDIVEQRGWVRLTEELLAQARKGEIPKVDGWLSEQEQARDPFPIFLANMGNIGMLGPITGLLAKFYTRVIGIRATIADMQMGAYNDLGANGIANVIREEIDLWLENVVLGRKLVSDLRSS
jgi:hypothetical protein